MNGGRSADAGEPTSLVLFEGDIGTGHQNNISSLNIAVGDAARAIGLVPPAELSASEMLWYSLAFTGGRAESDGWTCRTIPIPRPTDLSVLFASEASRFRPGRHYTGQICLRLSNPAWRVSISPDNHIFDASHGDCRAEFGFHSLHPVVAATPAPAAAAAEGRTMAERLHRWLDEAAWFDEFRTVFKL